jgi:hypothetical protein
MQMRSLRFTLALLAGAFTTTVVFANEGHDHDKAAAHGKLVSAKDAPADWLIKAKADYPTTQCVVSDEKLAGDMGGPVDYIYKDEGKPDRLVRFCCKNCVKDFNKNPAKYLGEIDKAAAKKPEAAKESAHMH